MPSTNKGTSPISAFQFFQVARYVSLLAASIFITKSTIGQSAIGHYETYLLIGTTLSFFWINGILTSYLRIYSKSANKPAVVYNTFLLMILCATVIALLLLVFRNPVNSFFSIEASMRSYWIFILYFFSNSISFFAEYILLSKERYKSLVILAVFHLIVQTTLIAAPVYFVEGFEEIITGLAVFMVLKCLVLGWLLIQNNYFKVDKAVLQQYKTSTPPLAISFFLGGISIYVDGIIVTHSYDKSTFAMYQYGAREFPLSLLLANAFSASMVQVASTKMQRGYADVKKGSERLMHLLFPVGIVLIASSKWLFPVVFNEQFSESFIYFNIYMLLLIPRLVFPHSILISMDKQKKVMTSAITEFILNISVSLLLMQAIGLQGIAYGTVFAFIANKVMLAWQLKNEGVAVNEYVPFRQLLLYSILLITVFILFTYFVG